MFLRISQTLLLFSHSLRTILVTENVFPYLLKRVPVRSRKDIVLEPIEIAIEMMQNRIEKLTQEGTYFLPVVFS